MKSLISLSLFVPLIAFLIFYIKPDFKIKGIHVLYSIRNTFKNFIVKESVDISTSPESISKTYCLKENERLFTYDELANYDGKKGSLGLYISFLGNVYDVSKGEKYYGPGGSYSFLAGKDASRAFITGDFEENSLIDDLSDISVNSFGDVKEWQNFYEENYNLIGKLIGRYYDNNGCPTSNIAFIQSMYDKYNQEKEKENEDLKLFPVCNIEFYADNNYYRVWCTDMSGGQKRSWVGVPRKLYLPKQQTYRCACVRNFGPPSVGVIEYIDYDNQNLKKTDSRDFDLGDLKNPRLKEYEKCDPKATSCIVYSEKKNHQDI